MTSHAQRTIRVLVDVDEGIATRTQHWSVTVERNGEQIVCIESNCLSGRDISQEDERIIRMAAEHLLSFIGAMKPDGSLLRLRSKIEAKPAKVSASPPRYRSTP